MCTVMVFVSLSLSLGVFLIGRFFLLVLLFFYYLEKEKKIKNFFFDFILRPFVFGDVVLCSFFFLSSDP